MTDGTTVTPVKEEDMAKVREVFQKALDAIIAATELSKQVQSMQRDVAQLRKDIEDTQARNVELDRMLADTRRQRDDAESKLGQVQADFAESQRRADATQHALSDTLAENDKLNASIEQVRKDRDDALLDAMAAHDALDKANAKLASLHKAMGVEFTPFTVPKAAPTPEPAPTTSSDVTWPEAPHPEQVDNPALPTRVYAPDPDFDWGKPYSWDSEKNQYYQEG